MVRRQQALEAIVYKIMEKETIKQELGIQFAEPQGCEGAGGAVTGGT